ncbi:MAG: class I SAM-dependent methyltransferase [Candidatus Gracilibacteria bacterium]|nr:class I SAM-dependent methyltransferase [Candidatus Gracilibacteria bacterium]
MYDAFAEAFARTRKKPWPDIQEVLSIITDKGYPKLGRVIDIGCGSGRLLGVLKNVDEYVGIDITQGLLDIAKGSYPEHRFELCDMTHIDALKLTMFDTVFFVASYHHILDPKQQTTVLFQAKKLLAPGGIIVLLNWNLRNQKNATRYENNWISRSVLDIPFGGHSRHYYAFKLEELRNIYTQCGLKILYHEVSQTHDNFLSILSLE